MSENQLLEPPDNPLPSLSLNQVLVVGFMVCYFIATAVFQMRSDTGPTNESAPLEFFTRSLLWMLSVTCLIIAARQVSTPRLIFWLLGCAALAALALDERFEFHEQTGRQGLFAQESLKFDDDYFKIISWALSPIVLFIILRMERPPRLAWAAIAVGLLCHSLYVLVEMGDGEFFRIPLAKRSLRWIEEICEVLFLGSYLVGFLIVQMGGMTARSEHVDPVDRSAGAQAGD